MQSRDDTKPEDEEERAQMISEPTRCFIEDNSEMSECPTTQETLCENLVSSKGYTYQVPQDKIPDLRDCEHGWYHLNGTFIVDATYQAENLGFVVSVTTENLTVSTCINIQWQLECDDIQVEATNMYPSLRVYTIYENKW
ncbi:Ribosome maturation factor RimM [Labeo rohita]|uniref:Ribosome maturation factor RimM n=1 Tax=Labeo rohita TaxID=84645 RepID=A0ABQ8M0B8_LABRO|nr:Ribosome maturation factor RimM [Labeo rohita]